MEGYSEVQQYFDSILTRNVYAHAYLIVGEQGSARDQFMRSLIKLFYCTEQNTPKPCSSCQSCTNIEQSIHPDFVDLASEEGKHAISIKQVRDLQKHIQQSPSVSPYTIALINNAHQLSLPASNALLKTLEEPSKTSILFLVTHSPQEILATIRSRSQIIYLPSDSNHHLDQDETAYFYELLASQRGEIFHAIDPLFSKKNKHSDEKQVWYQRLQDWKYALRSLYVLKLTGEGQSGISLNQIPSLDSLRRGIDSLSEIQNKLSQNVNIRLQVEHFFLQLLN